MQIVLTPSLIKFLLEHGYRYCLSKTAQIQSTAICVQLKPVERPPLAVSYADGFETYVMTHEEPARLAAGVDGVLAVACLEKSLLLTYVASLIGGKLTEGVHE